MVKITHNHLLIIDYFNNNSFISISLQNLENQTSQHLLMSISLITSRLEIFDNIKNFITILEARFLNEEAFLEKINLAKKSLEKSLIDLVFDLKNKIENPTQNSKKLNISSGVEIALEQLKDLGDKLLNQHLQELVIFTKNYENDFSQDFLQKNHEDLAKLKSKILLISAERFG